MKNTFFFLSAILIYVFTSCGKKKATPLPNNLHSCGYSGKAEISQYTLQQARYGEMRNGEATLIFVTEDFSTDNLVKLDEPEKESNKARVLKMNMTKNFITGSYPYSMMLSALHLFPKKEMKEP